jgi:dephospho-CoA kinase
VAEKGLYNTSKPGREITWGDKISKAKKGVEFSEEHRKALSAAQYGCSKNEWPGFYSKSEIHQIRDSIEYLEFRKQVMSRDNFKCTITGKTGNLEVHHLESVNIAKDKVLSIDNAVTLHASVHSMFHLKYGNGDNTSEQFNEFKLKFKPDRKLYFLCGQSGVGKTYVANKLKHKFEVVHYDYCKSDLIKHIAEASEKNSKPILLDIPALISTYYKELFGLYDIEMFFIIEDIQIVKDRLLSRGGKITDSVEKRYKRMQALYKKYGSFKATADDMYNYLLSL